MNSSEFEPILKTRLDQLPALPGVYLMKNSKGQIIYIGKAIKLNQRVKSYFKDKVSESHRAAALMRPHVADIEWIVTENELEALIVEANLVRKHRPRYNVRLKDDKHFPYLMVTLSEPFPRVKVVRKVKAKDGNRYFGPYCNVRSMRNILELVPKLFRIRDCDLKLPPKEWIKPCLSYHIKRCDAPCANLCTQGEYQKLCDELIWLLEGKKQSLIRTWEFEMKLAASEHRFEEAARYRDYLNDLNNMYGSQRVDLGVDSAETDVLAIAVSEANAVAVILEYRDGIMIERKTFPLSIGLDQSREEITTAFMQSYYYESSWVPLKVYCNTLPVNLKIMEDFLSTMRGRRVKIEKPLKGKAVGQLNIALRNAEMLLVESQISDIRRDEIDNSVFDLQNELQLKRPPIRIECYDISHLGGTHTVASGVCFISGRPCKKDYRRYRLKTIEGIDDFESMREILTRRVERLKKENQLLPDLFLIDGGKGQVNAVFHVLKNLLNSEDFQLIGLAKREEEIVFPGNKASIKLKKSSPALKLLQRARDEAHRFAITFQRESRKKDYRATWLDGIEGIGELTRKKILSSFATKSKLLSAKKENIEALIGIKKAGVVLKAIYSDASAG
jgi:excinuclease ABC subunit C